MRVMYYSPENVCVCGMCAGLRFYVIRWPHLSLVHKGFLKLGHAREKENFSFSLDFLEKVGRKVSRLFVDLCNKTRPQETMQNTPAN
jgi:hypothetical protein